MDRTCQACGRTFRYPSQLRRHQSNQKPCVTPTDSVASELILYPRPSAPETFSLGSELSALHAPPLPVQKQAQLSTSAPEPEEESALPPPPGEVRIFGEEEIDHLRKRLGTMLDLFSSETKGTAIIFETIKVLWKDPAFPHNMSVRNGRSGYFHVYTKDGWVKRTEDEMSPQIIEHVCNRLDHNQDHDIGLSPEGLVVLNTRSERLRCAFDVEAYLKDPLRGKEEAKKLIRKALT